MESPLYSSLGQVLAKIPKKFACLFIFHSFFFHVCSVALNTDAHDIYFEISNKINGRNVLFMEMKKPRGCAVLFIDGIFFFFF